MPHISKADLNPIKTVIFDCDGVLWLGDQLIPGALDLYKYLLSSNRRVFFVTNNSTKTTEEYLKKFAKLDFHPTVKIQQVFGAAKMAANYLKSINIKKVFPIGAKSIDHELSLLDIECDRHEDQLDPICDPKMDKETMMKAVQKLKLDDSIEAVVCGMDYNCAYPKFAVAATYIQNKNCKFIMTNPDASMPNDSHMVLPGGGMILGALERSIQKSADFIAGKPSPFCSTLIPDFDPCTSMMIGDRIETDVQFGLNSKCRTNCLVLSGASGKEKVQVSEQLHDDNKEGVFYGESVQAILERFQELESE